MGDQAGPAAVTMGVFHPATTKIARKICEWPKRRMAPLGESTILSARQFRLGCEAVQTGLLTGN
jgi:hypothetical protein